MQPLLNFQSLLFLSSCSLSLFLVSFFFVGVIDFRAHPAKRNLPFAIFQSNAWLQISSGRFQKIG